MRGTERESESIVPRPWPTTGEIQFRLKMRVSIHGTVIEHTFSTLLPNTHTAMRSATVTVTMETVRMRGIGSVRAERKRRDTVRGDTERRRRDVTSPHAGNTHTRTPTPEDDQSERQQCACLIFRGHTPWTSQ